MELSRVYSLPVVRVPRRRPLQRRFLGRRRFAGRDLLWQEAARVVDETRAAGQPVTPQTHPGLSELYEINRVRLQVEPVEVFVVPSRMLHLVGTPWMVILVWTFAGMLSLFGALGYAELGAAIPKVGGEYVYLHRAYSPLTGFLFGWTTFIIAKPASIAAIATAFVLYLSYFFPGLKSVILQFPLGGETAIQLTGLQVGAAVMIAFLSVVNVFGVKKAGAVQPWTMASRISFWMYSRRTLSFCDGEPAATIEITARYVRFMGGGNGAGGHGGRRLRGGGDRRRDRPRDPRRLRHRERRDGDCRR